MNVVKFVPKDNKILITILEDEKDLFHFFADGYRVDEETDPDIIKLNQDIINDLLIEIQAFESTIIKIKAAYDLEFLPQLTEHELDNLIRAIRHKLITFDFKGTYKEIKQDKKLKVKINSVFERLLPYYMKFKNIDNLDELDNK